MVDQLKEWLNSVLNLVSDTLGAKFEVEHELKAPEPPQELMFCSYVISPQEVVRRPKDFMNRETGTKVYDVLTAEANHAGVDLRHVMIDYSPSTRHARLTFSFGFPPMSPAAPMPRRIQLAPQASKTESDDNHL